MSTTTSEPRYKAIARRKQAERDAAIPPEWRLPSHLLPHASFTGSVMDVPSKCGILTARELSITEAPDCKSLVQRMTSGKVSATEVATAFCKRAAVAQHVTNCLTEPLFGSAVARARFLDVFLREEGRAFGPLHGLPVSVKDSFDVEGVDSSIGLAALCFRPVGRNAPLVELLLSLGAVVVAKTNVPQLLASLDSVNHVFGRTMNPINRRMTAGGSSGGEGVLVAMKGCMVGWGTDVGGSIRIPAMCNGVYGFKPGMGRLPYGGQEGGGDPGMGRVSVQATAGPLARSVQDLEFVLNEVVPRAPLWAEDCVGGSWGKEGVELVSGSGEGGKFVVGMMRRDGNCEPLPPITKVMDEVAERLRKTSGVDVVEVPTTPAWKNCQSLMNKLMSVSGEGRSADLLEETGEPLVPWMVGKFKRGKARTLHEVADMQVRRAALEREMLDVWTEVEEKTGSRKRKVDAIICPVAPHPVPEIERWNAVGYTSSFVMLDYPAGVIPVRDFEEDDLEPGDVLGGKALSTWDERNRELWDPKKVDRKVYVGTPLCIQVVTSRGQDTRLVAAMDLIDQAIHTRKLESKL